MRDSYFFTSTRRTGGGGGGGGGRRTGRVHVESSHLVDDQGPLLAQINTLFYAPWAEKNDVPRLDHEFTTLERAGSHGYRALNGLDGPSWADRKIDVRDVETMAKMVDRGFDRYGLRAWIVPFADGGVPGASTPNDRERITDEYADMLASREEKVIVFEFVNEISKGIKLPFDEVLSLCRRLRSRVGNIVIPSAPGSETHAQDLYGNHEAPAANIHLDRSISGDGGRFEPVWEMFESPHWVPGDSFMSGEPIGPWSSVNEEFDPLRLVATYAGGAIEGGALYCFHSGPGIRGGGAWNPHIPAFLDQTPDWPTINAGFRAMERVLPGDVASWDRHNGHWASNPLDFVLGQPHNGPFEDGRLFRACTVVRGDRFWTDVLRIRGTFEVGARDAMLVEVMDFLTGNVLATHDLSHGERFSLSPRPASGWNWDGDAVLLRGRFT